jgi:hypothetical protein
VYEQAAARCAELAGRPFESLTELEGAELAGLREFPGNLRLADLHARSQLGVLTAGEKTEIEISSGLYEFENHAPNQDIKAVYSDLYLALIEARRENMLYDIRQQLTQPS